MDTAMTANRTPISRPARPRFSDEALDIFGKLRRVRCTCPPHEVDWKGAYWEDILRPRCAGCQTWDELHGQLCHHWPGYRPWFWPLVEHPDAKNPYPPEHANYQSSEEKHAEASARWRQIDEALAERERLRRRERRARSKLEQVSPLST
jgi:hypothetical protein